MRSKIMDKFSVNPLVSIVVPIYNMGSKLESCVLSLVKQTYENIEIILIDDGSKDNSLNVCKSLVDKDNRISVYHTENQGSGPARNYGISQAKGKYIYFPDADDFLNDKAIEILVRKAEETNSDIIVFGYQSITPSGKVASVKKYENRLFKGTDARKRYLDFLLDERPYTIQGAPWNKFFKMEIVKRYNVEYPRLRRHQDEVFIARYISHVNTIQFIENILYSYLKNDLQKEWDKYPRTYIDDVIGLFNDRKENMLLWSKDDFALHDQVYAGYIARIIKSVELSFSPKFTFTKHKRIEWMRSSIKKSGITTMQEPKSLGRYQKIVLKLIKLGKMNVMYSLLHFKVYVEKNGKLGIVKRLIQR